MGCRAAVARTASCGRMRGEESDEKPQSFWRAKLCARDGKMKDIRAVEASVNPSEGKTPLVNAAVQNMKAWRFDSAEHNDPIRITFSYVIDTSQPHGGATVVDWALPGQVTVTAYTRE